MKTMKTDDRDEVFSYAAAILNYKNRSSQMLFDKLIEKEISPENAEYAVRKLTDYGYLNDAEYAASLVRSCMARGYGKMRIRRKLAENKLSEEIIEQALEGFKTDEDRLCAFISADCRDISDRKEREKTAGRLIRRGYSWEEVNSALRRVTEENGND